MEGIALLLFIIVIILILFGYPVAITLGGISVLAGLIFFDIDFFYLVSLRIFGIINNLTNKKTCNFISLIYNEIFSIKKLKLH